ncbi:MAG TPA: type I methionyl aminopeptidase, partial [Psychrobacter sp.]|nr:type I methionyl aminopeptidase [Psychrobacter sp.]
HVVCHGIPTESKLLKDGDIINIDVTVIKDGYYGDTSKMWIVGNGSIMAQRICKVAQDAL